MGQGEEAVTCHCPKAVVASVSDPTVTCGNAAGWFPCAHLIPWAQLVLPGF